MLTSKYIVNIRLESIFIHEKTIALDDNRMIYLMKEDLMLLQLLLEDRNIKLKGRNSQYLFCSYKNLYDNPLKKVKFIKLLKGL